MHNVFQKKLRNTHMSDQLTPPLKLNTQTPIGLTTQGELANPIDAFSLSLRADDNSSDVSSSKWDNLIIFLKIKLF